MLFLTIGTNIAALRKAQGMTQEGLANALGVTNQAVSKWESDQSCPDITLLPAIGALFGVTIDSLFGLEAPTPAPASDSAPAATLPWADDEAVRVVVFQGHTPLAGCESSRDCHLHLNGIHARNVYSYVNLTITGDVAGDAQAGGSLICDSVAGHVQAGGSVTCDNVEGNVTAGGNVTCDDVEGSVHAHGNAYCDSVEGDVTAGGTAHIG